jgi:L-amino acid N-acyltransferase YncA
MALLIRPARLEDAEGLVQILNPIIETGLYTVLDEPLTVEFERDFIATFPSHGLFYVAESQPEGRLVGCLSLEPFATYTHAFDHVAIIGTYVDLGHRQQGIGTQMANVAFPAAQKAGYEKIFSYVRADNPAALAFYRGLGFQVVGIARRQARIGARYVDEVLIEAFI